MRVRSVVVLSLSLFLMCPLFFFVLGPLSTEYDVTVALLFKRDEWYTIQVRFFFLLHIEVVCIKKCPLYYRLQCLFVFFVCTNFSCVNVCGLLHSEHTFELMRIVFE